MAITHRPFAEGGGVAKKATPKWFIVYAIMQLRTAGKAMEMTLKS